MQRIRRWSRAEGETSQKIPARFMQKSGDLYATLMGVPKPRGIVLRDGRTASGSDITLLGAARLLECSQNGVDIEAQLPFKDIWVLRVEPAP